MTIKALERQLRDKNEEIEKLRAAAVKKQDKDEKHSSS